MKPRFFLQATWVDPDPAVPSRATTAATQAPAVAAPNAAAAQSAAGPSSSTRIAAEGSGEPLELRSGGLPFLLCKQLYGDLLLGLFDEFSGAFHNVHTKFVSATRTTPFCDDQVISLSMNEASSDVK